MIVFALRLGMRPLAQLRNQIEMGALYWHFVDGVWVFLYPILYLVERHG
jgi:cytochrome c oxidase subunit 3